MISEPKGTVFRRIARNGVVISLRPMRDEDGPQVVELFRALSHESIYNRFLTPIVRLDAKQVRKLTHVDPGLEYAVAAWLSEAGCERMVGVGRYHAMSTEVAEIGIVVGDPWHRLGIGKMLLRQLTESARARGLLWFASTIDPCNLRLLRFVEACGFKGHLKYHDGLLHMRTAIATLFLQDSPDPPLNLPNI